MMRPLLAALPLVLLTACTEPAPEAPPAPPPATHNDGVGTRPPKPAASTPSENPEKEVKLASGAIMKSFAMPGGEVMVPPAWSPKYRQDAPMTSLHVMPLPGMTCDLAVLEGHGNKRQAEEYLTAGAKAYDGAEERAPDVVVGGKRMQGIKITNPRSFPNNKDAVVEVYASISAENLIGLGVTRLEKDDKGDAARADCFEAFAAYVAKLPDAPGADAEGAPPAPAQDKPAEH